MFVVRFPPAVRVAKLRVLDGAAEVCEESVDAPMYAMILFELETLGMAYETVPTALLAPVQPD